MATTKKKAAVEPEESLGTAPEMSRTAPFKPRNIAAYEAAVEQFASASSLFVKGRFAEAQPYFAAVAEAAAADEPILSDRARTYASICGRRIATPDPVGDDANALYHRGVVAANPAGSTRRGRPSRRPSPRGRTTRASCTPALRCAAFRATRRELRPSSRRRSLSIRGSDSRRLPIRTSTK